MKTFLRPAILLCMILVVVMQGCENDDEPKEVVVVEVKREKPASRTKLLGRTEATGVIEIQPDNWHEVLIVEGPGSFLSAVVSKKGGNSAELDKKTLVRLRLDGKQILLKSFEVARAMGLSEQNYSGIVWLDGENNVETLVLGYSEPLYFSRVLKLSIKVDDPDVEKVFLSVTFTKEDTGDDEHTGGGDSEPEFP